MAIMSLCQHPRVSLGSALCLTLVHLSLGSGHADICLPISHSDYSLIECACVYIVWYSTIGWRTNSPTFLEQCVCSFLYRVSWDCFACEKSEPSSAVCIINKTWLYFAWWFSSVGSPFLHPTSEDTCVPRQELLGREQYVGDTELAAGIFIYRPNSGCIQLIGSWLSSCIVVRAWEY